MTGTVSGMMNIYLFAFGLHDGILFLSFVNGGFCFFKNNRVYMRYGNACRKVFFFSRKINVT